MHSAEHCDKQEDQEPHEEWEVIEAVALILATCHACALAVDCPLAINLVDAHVSSTTP